MNAQDPDGPRQYRVYGAFEYVTGIELFHVDFVADENGYRPTRDKGYLFTPRITADCKPEPEELLEDALKNRLISNIQA